MVLKTEGWKEHTSLLHAFTRMQSKSHNQRTSEVLCAQKVDNWDVWEQAYNSISLFSPSLSHTNIFKSHTLTFLWDFPLPGSHPLCNAHHTANMKFITLLQVL